MNTNTMVLEKSSVKINVFFALIGVGLLGLAASFYFSPVKAWINILGANFFFLSIALFGTFMLALTNIVGASFVTPYRKILEALASTVPYLSLSMLTVLLGSHTLYEWTHTDIMLNDKILVQKMAFLNLPFFIVRMVLCLGIWSAISTFFIKKYREQEANPSRAVAIQEKLVGQSAVSMILFALTFCLASFDWIMSLEPHWFSTIFGIFTFSGLMVSGLAFTIVALISLQAKGYLQREVNENHYHDLGKLLFGFSTFWAYIWFCQYLLIWYANIPEEAEYYVLREHNGWPVLFWLNLVINWVIPFFVLLPRNNKRNKSIMQKVSWLILVGQALNIYILIAPKVLEHNGVHSTFISWQELTIYAGYAGLFMGLFFKRLSTSPIVPQNSPYLEEGMALEQ